MGEMQLTGGGLESNRGQSQGEGVKQEDTSVAGTQPDDVVLQRMQHVPLQGMGRGWRCCAVWHAHKPLEGSNSPLGFLMQPPFPHLGYAPCALAKLGARRSSTPVEAGWQR